LRKKPLRLLPSRKSRIENAVVAGAEICLSRTLTSLLSAKGEASIDPHRFDSSIEQSDEEGYSGYAF
jgi:hypothetical protein